MLSLRRVSVALVFAGGLAWAVFGLRTTESHQAVESDSGTVQSPAEADSSSSPLAARYHLRKRTSRFFQRSVAHVEVRSTAGSQRLVPAGDEKTHLLAARYHLRNRTARFFRRAAA